MPARTPPDPAEKPVPEITEGPAVNEPEETIEELRARIKSLEADLEKSHAVRDLAVDESARLSAQAQSSIFTTAVVERYAGKTDAGEDLFWYRIDLAPCGGVDIKINGKPYLHGETYKFDVHTLRAVKEIIARTWVHENDIHGHDANPYKRRQNAVLGRNPAPAWALQ